MKHERETTTVGNCINRIQSDNPWYEVMCIDLPGMAEAEAEMAVTDDDGQQAVLDKMAEIESAWLKIHADDEIEVGWPEHVLTPRYNSDATFYHNY